MLTRFVIAAASFLVLDGLWLGVVMSAFYREHLGPIALTAADGSLAPIWAATVPVYVLMALGISVFVAPRVTNRSLLAAAGYGAVFGWVLFGVYDFTNYSTLRNYPLTFALVDSVWGGVTCALTSIAVVKFGPSTS